MDIVFKKLIPEAITPATDKDGLILDLYAAEDAFISPNEIQQLVPESVLFSLMRLVL